MRQSSKARKWGSTAGFQLDLQKEALSGIRPLGYQVLSPDTEGALFPDLMPYFPPDATPRPPLLAWPGGVCRAPTCTWDRGAPARSLDENAAC